MRTLALLGALLLLAVQAQAEPLRDTADRVPARAQPEPEDQAQPGAEDQAMAISFAGDGRLAREASGLRRTVTCYCRSSCRGGERVSGSCTQGGRRYKLCCS